MNPLHVIYCWETLLLAGLASLCTEALKIGLDLSLSDRADIRDSLRRALRSGADIRKQHIGITQGFLPLVPVIVGALIALVLPTRPDELAGYADYIGWGAFCGAVGDYAFTRAREPFKALKNDRTG